MSCISLMRWDDTNTVRPSAARPRTSCTSAVSDDSPLAQPVVLPGTWTENLAAHTGHQPATGTSDITTHTHDRTPIDHTVR